ncbi:MAG: hypothetical protein ACR2RE_12985 [Geminicoccaceae bacterium]
MISKETTTLARRLVTCEENMRRAVTGLNGFIADPTADIKKALDHAGEALVLATHLADDLVEWTASSDVQEKKHLDHIDMMCHMDAFNCGVFNLTMACETKVKCRGSASVAVKSITAAMVAICGSHVDLKKLCRCDPVVDIPDFPTTRDGGGR